MNGNFHDDVEIFIDREWVAAVPLSQPVERVFTAEDRKHFKKWRLHTSWENLVWRWPPGKAEER